MPARNETHHHYQARTSTRSRVADSHEETVDGERRELSNTVRSSLTMSVVSPGRLLLIFLVISEPLISNTVANKQTSGENDKSVVIEILDVSQPYNCTAFFDDLEVRN